VKRTLVVCLMAAVGGLCLAAGGSPAYRNVSAGDLAPPCGGSSHFAITSRADLDRLSAGFKEKCGQGPAAEWRRRVENAKIDFSKEALVVLYEIIGTGGKAKLEAVGPTDGVLNLAIAWETPKGPALPIATAAAFVVAVDKSQVKRVELGRGARGSGELSIDLTRP